MILDMKIFGVLIGRTARAAARQRLADERDARRAAALEQLARMSADDDDRDARGDDAPPAGRRAQDVELLPSGLSAKALSVE
jgi:hypothetical protein